MWLVLTQQGVSMGRPLLEQGAPSARLAALKVDTARRTRSLREPSHDFDGLGGGGGFYSPASSLAGSPFAASGTTSSLACA